MERNYNHLIYLGSFFKKTKKKQEDIAKDLSVTQQYVSSILSGKKSVGKKVAAKLSELYGLSYSWLLTGEGEMLSEQSTTNIASNNTYGDNASGNNNITITNARTRTREEDEGDKYKEIVFRPVVTKQLATQSDTDVYSVIKEDKTLKLQYIPAIPPYTSIDFYYTIRQDAMLPEYKLGEVLALEHMKSNSDIVQGAAMVVDTSDFGFLFRRIYDRGDYYECRRINENSVFENQNVPKSKVIRLYRVIYSMKFGD